MKNFDINAPLYKNKAATKVMTVYFEDGMNVCTKFLSSLKAKQTASFQRPLEV